MNVTVTFYSGFEKYLLENSNKTININLAEQENIINILHRFLPEEAIGFVGMVLVNKKIVDFDYKVEDKDKIEVLPIIGGG